MLPTSESKTSLNDDLRHASCAELGVLARVYDSLLLRKLQQAERRKQFLQSTVRLWPVAVGLVLASFAPLLRDMLSPLHPWGMRLIFPYAVLSARPEIQLGGAVSRILPQVMLYAQFPIEGLLAKIVLKGRVTLSGVAGQLLLFHFLGAAELWLLGGESG